MTDRFIVHPDLMHFDLRRPYREWPESVRKLIEERQAAERANPGTYCAVHMQADCFCGRGS